MKWIVVGAGSGGSVAARRLCDAGNRVTLFEGGPPLEAGNVPSAIDGDDSFAALRVAGRVDEGLVARRTMAGPTAPYIRGRGVGGSSVVNAMVALRGDPARYRAWGWDDVDEAWSRTLIPAERPTPAELGRIDRLLLDADDEAEIVPLTRRGGRRITSAEAYLWPLTAQPRTPRQRTPRQLAPRQLAPRQLTSTPPIRRQPRQEHGVGLDIRANQVVDRVEFDASGAAIGVVLADGERVDADAVVVAAGAIHTPAILQRSGIDGAGNGLRDHPAAGLLLRLSDSERTHLDPTSRGLATASMIARGAIQVLSLNHLGPSSPPDTAMLLVALMRPTGSGGRVRIRTDDPREAPSVDFDLLREPADRDRLARGVADVFELLDREPFAGVVDAVYIDDRGTTADTLGGDLGAIGTWLSTHGADYVHATSSCAAVVGDDGGVAGHEALYLCDASVFPDIPDVNTHLPTTMLAERLTARWPGVAGSSV